MNRWIKLSSIITQIVRIKESQCSVIQAIGPVEQLAFRSLLFNSYPPDLACLDEEGPTDVIHLFHIWGRGGGGGGCLLEKGFSEKKMQVRQFRENIGPI